MPETVELVINTGPLLAIVAAMGDLRILEALYKRVLVPLEIREEILAGGAAAFGVGAFEEAAWLEQKKEPARITPFLGRMLDRGEASVIQTALEEGVETVCIDEAAGRRVARLNGLKVTGSVGVLLRAKKSGWDFSMAMAIRRMTARGIWLGASVIHFALREAGEDGDI